MASISGCGPPISAFPAGMYKKANQDAFVKIPQACEIERVFGNANHNLSADHGGISDGQWKTDAYFADRYVLHFSVDIKVDCDRGTVLSVSDQPTMFIEEYERLDDDNGRWVGYGGKQFRLTAADWKKVVDAGGDFSVIGVTIIKDRPVQNFRAYAVEQVNANLEPYHCTKIRNDPGFYTSKEK
jgi:hypothetical protein